MSGSLAERAYGALKRDIITCSLRPGQQVVQAQLSDHYGYGATPVREALQRLEQEGFVEAVPRFGYVISSITLRDVGEIYELRLIIESSAARLAASRARDEELEGIREECDFSYVYGDTESYTHFLSQNVEFHRSVAVAAGNERMVDFLTGLLQEMTRIFHLGLDLRDSAEEMRREHVELAETLLNRDPDGAEEIVRKQIEASQNRVFEALTRYGGLELPRGLSASS